MYGPLGNYRVYSLTKLYRHGTARAENIYFQKIWPYYINGLKGHETRG